MWKKKYEITISKILEDWETNQEAYTKLAKWDFNDFLGYCIKKYKILPR